MLVPILCSYFIFGNHISLSQIIGLVLLIFAVVLMTIYNNKIKTKLTVLALLLLLTISLANGFSSFLQQVFNVRFSVLDSAGKKTLSFSPTAFNFYIYVFSAGIMGVLWLVLSLCNRKKMEQQQSKEPLFDRRKLCYIAVMALCLFCNSYFVTLARGYIPPARLDPLLNGLAIMSSTVMAAVFFKERVKLISIIGLLVMFTGMLFTSVIIF
jgi:multidrug transporter EmrE-like cation transporter